MKKNILFLTHAVDIGGAEQSLLLFLEKINRDMYTPIVVCSNEGNFSKRVQELDIEYITVNMYFEKKWAKFFVHFHVILQLLKIIKKYNISVIHANKGIVGKYAVILSKLTGVISIWHSRDVDRLLLGDKLIKYADIKIAISQAGKNFFPEDVRDDIKVIYNGVDLTYFDIDKVEKGRIRAEFNIKPTDILIGNVGRLTPLKAQDNFIQAAVQIKKNFPNTKFLIVGDILSNTKDQVYKESLKLLVKELGLEGNVIFTGFRRDLPNIFRDLDIFVLCSREPEAFGRVVIEAMAMEVPVISTNGGGVPEIIEDKKDGILIPMDDVESIVSSVAYLLQNPKIMKKIRFAGRKKVQKFSVEKYVGEMEKMLEEAICLKLKIS